MPSARRLIFSAVTLIPGVASLPPVKRILMNKAKGTGGSISASYCYSVWLRHLVTTAGCGLNCNPRTVAELGPGDSLGVGLAALLSGAEKCRSAARKAAVLASPVDAASSASGKAIPVGARLRFHHQRRDVPGRQAGLRSRDATCQGIIGSGLTHDEPRPSPEHLDYSTDELPGDPR